MMERVDDILVVMGKGVINNNRLKIIMIIIITVRRNHITFISLFPYFFFQTIVEVLIPPICAKFRRHQC